MKIEDIIQESLELRKDLEYHIMQHKFYQNRCIILEERLEYVEERLEYVKERHHEYVKKIL